MKQFVTFEGIDGSGKSTISKIVYKKLKSKGHDVVLTCEPTDSWLGKKVKKCIETNTDPYLTSFAFIADRIEHCKKIDNWLSQGKIVLCDRYAESTYAYQGVQMQDLVDSPMKWLKDMSKERIIEPDKTFVFFIDPKKAISRINHRDNLIPFEKTEFLEKVQKNYEKLAKGKRFLKIDATKSKKELTDLCIKEILS